MGDVLEVTRNDDTFAATTLDEVEKFLRHPAAWSAAHGGIGEFKPA